MTFVNILRIKVNRQKENNLRLETLFTQSDGWLKAVAFNLCKNKDTAEELVSELYLYLAEKCNPALWYLNSFNLMYCHSFLKSRFLNRIKVAGRNTELSPDWDDTDTDYDTESDERIEEAYNSIIDELKRLERTKMWTSSKLYQIYAFDGEMTYEKMSEEIGICKSTAYLHCKKIKKHLKDTQQNPFKPLPE